MVHFWLLAKVAEMGSHGDIVPGLHRPRRYHEGESRLSKSQDSSSLASSCLFLFFLSLSFLLSATDCGRLFSHSLPLLLRSFSKLSFLTSLPPFVLYSVSSPFLPSPDGSKAHRRGLPTNSGGERLGTWSA
jgi:hypothetical protein